MYVSFVSPDTGAWVHTHEFVDALNRKHHDVAVFLPGPRKDRFKRAGRIGKMLSLFFGRFHECLREIERARPDVLVLRGGLFFAPALIARLKKIPLILEVNGPAEEKRFIQGRPQRSRRLGGARLEPFLVKVPNLLTVVSRPLKDYYVELGVSAQRIKVVPNGVDLKKFNPRVDGCAIRAELGLEGRPVIGFFGTFAPWHGLESLIQAVLDLGRRPGPAQEAVLLLIGRPGDETRIKALPPDRVVVTGYVPHERIPEYLAAVDIFVAPYPKIEPFYFSPLKIFEAMAMGKPVVASAQGQILELIQDGVSGFLYPAGDQEALEDRIDRLIRDPEAGRKAGQKAFEVMAGRYTWERNAETVLDLCLKLISG